MAGGGGKNRPCNIILCQTPHADCSVLLNSLHSSHECETTCTHWRLCGTHNTKIWSSEKLLSWCSLHSPGLQSTRTSRFVTVITNRCTRVCRRARRGWRRVSGTSWRHSASWAASRPTWRTASDSPPSAKWSPSPETIQVRPVWAEGNQMTCV